MMSVSPFSGCRRPVAAAQQALARALAKKASWDAIGRVYNDNNTTTTTTTNDNNTNNNSNNDNSNDMY